MIIYQFRSKDGDELDIPYDISDAPTIGSWVRVKGKRYQRVVSIQKAVVKNSRHTAYTLPRRWQNTWLNSIHDKWDGKGRAVFESKSEIERFEGKAASIGKAYKFDPGSGVDQSAESS